MGLIQKVRDLSKMEEVQEVSFKDDINYAFQNELSVAFVRLPGKDFVRTIIGEKAAPIEFKDVESLSNGLLVKPFASSGSLQIISPKKEKVQTIEVLNQLKDTEFDFYTNEDTSESSNKEDYIKYVEKAISSVEQGNYQKLVCARKVVESSKINPIASFLKLCEAYPNAFVSLISTKAYGTWLGASPEVLLKQGNNKLLTVALAGTQLVTDSVYEKNAAWTTKEIEEQALVSRYIINQFKKIRLREFEDIGPRTVRAGNLLHLKTEFHIDKTEVDVENLKSKLLELLHPTSAVCGMPQESSEQFILDNEQMNRELFTGFYGLLDSNELNAYVNLRCMKINKNSCTFYAGAGITQDSDPKLEWEETNHKIDTLRSVLI